MEPINKSEVVTNFQLTNQDLAAICDFDKRNDSENLDVLKKTYGGLQGVAKLLKTDLKAGINLKNPYHRTQAKGTGKPGKSIKSMQRDTRCEDQEERLEAFGENIIPPTPSETILQIIVGTVMDDPILKVLIVGAVVVMVFGTINCPSEGWSDGLAIIIAVVIVLGVTAGNDWSKERKFKKLLLLQTDKKCRVIRGGEKFEISSWDILVGDVVELVVGDEVAADGIFIRGNGLVIDESPLTGESIPVRKTPTNYCLFSGCQVTEGTGFMLVTAVGVESSGGKIQAMLSQTEDDMTPLQEKLKHVAVLIGKAGVAAGITTFLSLGTRWAISYATLKPLSDTYCHGVKTSYDATSALARLAILSKEFVIAITIVVVAVPEGLPLAVTLALSLSMFKMMKEKCFVRHLDASETMGQATTVCTDKTGTLTYNRMSVVRLQTRDHTFRGEGSGDKDAIPFSTKTLSIPMRDIVTEACCINSNCFIKNEDQVDEANATPQFVGSATEGSMLILSKKLGVKYAELREKLPAIANGVWSFSAERKRMSTMIKVHETGNYRLHTKGAPEIVCKLCTHVLDPESMKVIPLSEKELAEKQNTINKWASEGLRTIAIAYRDYDHPLDSSKDNDVENNLTLIALLAIKDPLRKQIPQAVSTCQTAGIVVRMVTGDNLLTAIKIAKEANICFGDGICIEGPKFREMSKEEKIAILPKLQVLARCSPADKFDLVSLLQECGEVVAVTGDGTNDAPALRQADIGFSMGICGTQVAMNASDIVLLDDNFTSIVSATKWGRNVLNTIRKFLQFQLGINAAAIIITLVGSAVSEKSPLNTIQLLLVNLIMDSLGALALASDDPDAAIMTTPPQRKTDSVVTRNMWEYIGVQAFYQTSSCIVLMYGVDKWIAPDWTVHTDPQDLYMDPDGITPSARTNTMVFLAFILMQITNLICTRTLNGELNVFSKFWKNPMFLYMEGAILIIVCSAVGFAYRAFGCTTLSGYEWAICITIALLNFPVVFLSRVAFNIYKGKRGVGQVADLKQDTTKTKFDRDDLEEDNVMKSHTSLTAKDATRVSQSSIVEVFRKIKVDAPMKTKSQSLNSLRSRK